MQLLATPPSAPLSTAADVSPNAAHSGSVDNPVKAAAAPVDTPAAAIGAPIVPASAPVEATPLPAATVDESVLGVDTFITNSTPGATINSQGVYATFYCPKTYGYDLVTEKLEYRRMIRAPWEERDKYIRKRTISTEMYETCSVISDDLPGWARGLEAPAPSSTIEGGANVVPQANNDDISAVTTPARATSMESVTTPGQESGSLSSDGFYFTKSCTPDAVSHHNNTSGNASAPASATTDTDTPVAAAATAPAAAVPMLPTTPARRPGLFESMGISKPVLDGNLDETERRHALISFALDHIDKSNTAAKAIAATEETPEQSPIKFAAFTPNTTRFFEDCEEFHDSIMALPSLTPLFQAAFKATPCERKVVATTRTPVIPPVYAGPSASAAGPSTAIASASRPRPPLSKKVTSGSVGPSAGTRSVSASRKRARDEVHEISSDDDEVKPVKSSAKPKGQGKVKAPSSAKKQKGI